LGESDPGSGCPGRSENQEYLSHVRSISELLHDEGESVLPLRSVTVFSSSTITCGSTDQPYQEKGEDYFSELDRQHAERRLTKQLEHLGYQVTLTPAKIA
jgi:hypothetical protein